MPFGSDESPASPGAPSAFRLQKRSGPKAAAALFRRFLQLLEAAAADPTGGKIDDAGERPVVIRVGDQPEIGERMFHFLALEKAQPAIYPVRHTRAEKRVFQYP